MKAVQEAKEAADLVEAELFALDPEIFDGSDSVNITDEEAALLLENTGQETLEVPAEPVIMADFDAENGTDGKSALSDLKAVQCPFIQDDIVFWFGQLEGQLEIIEVKSQWMKRIAVQRFLPPEVQTEVRSLLSLGKTAAGDDIYLKIKRELIELFGHKPEDGYTRAKNRVLTGKPSQLGKLIINDLCKKDTKLQGCCCADTTWGMFREALPIVVRNHIAEETFSADTYKKIFKKADQVFESNQASEPAVRPVSAVSSAPKTAVAAAPQAEVAAVQKNQGGRRNKNNKPQQNQNKPQKDSGEKPGKKGVNDENLCRMHAKWKRKANFCSAPWACKMKNIFKEPQ